LKYVDDIEIVKIVDIEDDSSVGDMFHEYRRNSRNGKILLKL